MCAVADGMTQSYVPDHVYVHYTGDHLLCNAGAEVDVTSDLTMDTMGHVHDLYGNLVVPSSTDNTVSDGVGTVVGFIYRLAPN